MSRTIELFFQDQLLSNFVGEFEFERFCPNGLTDLFKHLADVLDGVNNFILESYEH